MQRKNSEIILAIGVIAIVAIFIFAGQSIPRNKEDNYSKNINTEQNTKKKVCVESGEDCLFAGCNGFY